VFKTQNAFRIQLKSLLRRNVLLAFLEPTIYGMRAAMMIGVVIFFGIVYIETREEIQSTIFPRMLYLTWCISVPGAVTMIVVYSANVEFRRARCEISNGMYSPLAYCVAQLCLAMPMQLVLAACIQIPAHLVGNWPWDSFGLMIVVCACYLFCWESLGHALSLHRNPLVGMLLYLANWYNALLFLGLFFNADSVIWPLRSLAYLYPMSWCFNAYSHLLYKHAKYGGTLSCVPDAVHCPRGFVCNDVPDQACFGSDGIDILSSLGTQYDIIGESDDVLVDCMMMLALGVVFKAVHFIGLVHQCRLRSVVSSHHVSI